MDGRLQEWIADRLPPRPDPLTGEPRPPAAAAARPRRDVASWRAAAHRPRPPGGLSPTLEGHAPGLRETALVSVVALAVMVVFTLIQSGSDVDWIIEPSGLIWGMCFAFAGTIVVYHWAQRIAAGADWLRVRRRWVHTYELTEARVRRRWGRERMFLKDSVGRSLSVDTIYLKANSQLYDLVRNGLLHSWHRGPMQVPRTERQELGLDVSPAWKLFAPS